MKTWKQIQQQLATEFDLPLSTVESHTTAYWQYIRKSLGKPTIYPLQVIGLCRWVIRPRNLFRQLAFSLIMLRRLRAGDNLGKTEKRANQIQVEMEAYARLLWTLKQDLQLGNTSQKPNPKTLLENHISYRPES